MSLVFSFKRRRSLAICLAILKAAKNGTKKTHLLNSVSLSYGQMIRYAGFLKHYGFVEEYGNMLRTTDKGLELTSEYDSSSSIHVFTSA